MSFSYIIWEMEIKIFIKVSVEIKSNSIYKVLAAVIGIG